MAEHNELGEKGEFLAARHLEQKGYLIKFKNYRAGRLEIDIIAEKNDRIVFVEVKTRVNTHLGDPEMAVNKKKQAQIIKAADAFFRETDCNLEARFDIISIVLSAKREEINHIEDAFFPLARKR